MAPSENGWNDPPVTGFWGPVGSPGAHWSESYSVRIGPWTFLSTLIQTLSSRSPSAPENTGPETRTVVPSAPPVPFAVIQMIRPETLRWTLVNPVTTPTS